MNKKPINANLVAGILIASILIILAGLPISIEIKTSAVEAQETPTTSTELVSNTTSTVEYTIRTVIGLTPSMAFIGVGGDIDNVINPTLNANVGDTLRITITNGDPILHDFTISVAGVSSGQLTEDEQTAVVEFTPTAPGDYEYSCSVPGHRDVGMHGVIHVEGDAAPMDNMAVAAQPTPAPTVQAAAADAVSIVRSPADVPASVGNRAPTAVQVHLTAQEVTGILADGATYNYFTFDGAIPGPMIRVRVGDTVELTLSNADGSLFPHSIDLHAVTGPGGGAVYTQTNPGDSTSFSFQALSPGLYVYHCATPSVAHHIANGMFGLILVEPEGGLPPVDREFYVMESEIYTAEPFGSAGHLTFSHEAMLDEAPEYYVFNGAANALASDDNALRANVGETVRIFFGVGGPNATSSFHVIGEIFDRVYSQASLTSEPLTDVQTTTVAPGGAVMVEFGLEVPGRYILVDHALARMERGLAGFLYVEGDENPGIFHGDQLTEGSGH
jgi:nitrite reductase (NO-forming)